MKGFMHIVEILMVVVLLFLVFAQFAAIPDISGDWPETKLSLMAYDILTTFEKKDVSWFNQSSLAKEFNNTLPANVIYSVTLQNVLKPKIKIGCLCTGSEYAIVKNILTPDSLVINGLNTSFELVQIGSVNELFSLDFDVALVYGHHQDYEGLAGNPMPLRRFLDYDKGVVEIIDQPKIDALQQNYFGLSTSSTMSNSSWMVFSSPSEINGRDTNKIYDYFNHIPMFSDSFESADQWFGGSMSSQGNPPPSISLTDNNCVSDHESAVTRFYNTFRTGEIDFDVRLSTGASLLLGFGRSSDYEYFAMLSSNQSGGYDAFLRKAPYQSIGSNVSHLTAPGIWHHIKIVVKMNELALYNDGQKVAIGQAAGLLYSSIILINKCGEALVDNVRITQTQPKEFENFLNGENTTQFTGNLNKILLLQKGTSLPACVINYNIYTSEERIGNGRTAWLSEAASVSDDYRTLVKALLAWAAGDEYQVIKADIKKPISAYIYKPLNKDMMQNMKIVIQLGYLY
jgi:hypothetical protein